MLEQIFFIFLLAFSLSPIYCQFEYQLEYTIQENHPAGLQVGHISTDIKYSRFTINVKQFDSTYSFILRDKSTYFTLDSKSSILKTSKEIDLEYLCPSDCNDKGVGTLNLLVNVWKENQLQGVIRVKISIYDQNDNIPTFPSKEFVKKIKEVLYSAGKIIELPKATDRDVSEINKKILYSLSEESDTFQLIVTNDNQPRLRLIKDIDYEQKTLHVLTLMAWNDVQPNLKAYLTIRIEVIDMNDCEPTFRKPHMQFMIDENAKIEKLITKLEAVDKDKNSVLKYSIDPSTKQSTKETFAVKENGEILLMKALDAERQPKHEFSVLASDGEFTASAKIEIFVQDVNNHPPSYNLNPAILSIEEGSPAKSLVGQVTVTDVDSPAVNGDIRCKEPQGKSNLQDLVFRPDPAINPTALKYEVFSRIPLDREEGPVRLVYLICHDGGLHGKLTSTLTVSLKVMDINDNPPIFPKSFYDVKIEENNSIGDKTIKIVAVDKDDADNAAITYSIINSQYSNIFFIDPKQGWISIMRELDREEKASYQFVVEAKNTSPKITYTATTTVNITVLDVNDNKPRLLPPSQFTIVENSKPLTFIGNINAQDDDIGDNGKVTFSFNNPTHSDLFEIKYNGSIYSKLSFDRELQDRYCLNIRLSDRGAPRPLSVTGTVCVIILDANDNAPVISVTTFNGGLTFSENNTDKIIASVYETPGQKIAQLSAYDADKDDNAKVSFHIEDITEESSIVPSLFTVNDYDGSITISRIMSRDDIGEYKVKVIVQDRGEPKLRSEKIIKVSIQDIQPYTSSSTSSPFQLSGNVLIVIILSIVSAFLTALLVGAILCMIRPCYKQSSQSTFDSQARNATGQSLQKLTQNYYTPNSFSQFESKYDQNWKGTLNRNNLQSQELPLEYFTDSMAEKGDLFAYDSSKLYVSHTNLCNFDHMVGKPSGCSCGQNMCTRYGSHSQSNCFLNPEEQCSDSGRGASDDDMKILNVTGSLVTTRPPPYNYGTYSLGESRSKSPWSEAYYTQNRPNTSTDGEVALPYNQMANSYMYPSTSSHIPLTTFQSSSLMNPQEKLSVNIMNNCNSIQENPISEDNLPNYNETPNDSYSPLNGRLESSKLLNRNEK